MKKFLSLLLVLCAAITISAGNIASGTFKNGGTWKISSNGELYIDATKVPDYNTTTGGSYVERTFNIYNVKFIDHCERTGAPWGSYAEQIKSIHFSSQVQSIGSNAFAYLYYVQSVIFDEHQSANVTIGQSAFQSCLSLKEFDFTYVYKIDNYAFKNCKFLPKVILPAIKEIKDGAFSGCVSLYTNSEEVFGIAITSNTIPTVGKIIEKYGDRDNYIVKENAELHYFHKRGAKLRVIVPVSKYSSYGEYLCAPYRSSSNSETKSVGEICAGEANKWYYTKSNLTIIGSMGDFEAATESPWYSLRSNIYRMRIYYVRSIGNNAFSGCTNLHDFIAPAVESIGENAFSGCTNLTGFECDELKTIGRSAFKDCSNLTKLNLDNVTSIADNAFSGTSLSYVKFGSKLQSIGGTAFQNTFANGGDIYILSAAPITSNNAFQGANVSSTTLHIDAKYASSYQTAPWNTFSTALSVTYPVTGYNPHWELTEKGVLTISSNIPNYSTTSEQPWYNYRDFIHSIVLSEVVTTVGKNAFAFDQEGKSKIREIIAPSVTSIGNNAFKNNDALISFAGENVKTIGDQAFAGCEALEDVDFGDKLASLGSRVFDGCPVVANFAVDAITPPSVNSQTFVGMGASASNAPGRGAKASGSGQQSVTLSVPEEATVNYLAAPYWNLFSMEFIEGHGSIVKSGAYYDGAWVLYSDGTLIASSQTTTGSIDVATVYNDATVTRVEFLGGANEVKSTFFSNLPNLKTVVLNAAVNKVGYRTFQNCAKLESINLENVDTIESEAFKGCSKLASVYLSSIRYINTNAFEGCTQLASVQLAGGCRIRSRAFKGCTSLTSIDLKGATIDGYVFEGCTALSSISNGGLQITTNAFNGCSALKKFDLGSGCWTVYSNAFANTNMQTIYCSRPEPTKLYADAFGSLTLSNITAYVPADYIRMYQKADVWKDMTLKIDTTFESMLPTGGAFGDKGTWQLDDKGTLMLTGTGSMPVLTNDNRYHWNHVFDEWAMFTEDVIISDGWTGINTVIADKNATANKYKNIKTLELGADIKLIRDSSLRYPNLTDVYCYIPDPVNIQTSAKNCPFDKAALIANNATLHVINFTGTKAKYQNSSAWNWFPNIVDDLVTRKEGIIYVTNVYMDKSFDMLAISQSDLGTTTYQLNAGVQPANATTTALAWSSSNPSVATVDQNGLVTFVGFDANDTHGSVTITAKATDGSGKKASCDFSIYDADEVPETVYVEEIDVDKHAVTRLKSQPEDPVVMIRVTPANAVRSFSTVVAEDVGFMAMDVMNDHGDIIGLSIVPWGDKTGTTTVTVTANNPGATQANLPSVTFTVTIQEDIIFVEDTKEGVPVTYIVDDLDKKTCHLYGAHKQIVTVDPNTGALDSKDEYINAVDPSTTGIVTIPTSVRGYAVTGVGDYAFRNCASITEVNFCAGMERIGEGAFQGCNALTTLRLPYTFKGLGLNMASMLPNLKDVHLLATTIPTSFDWSDATMSGEEAIGTGAFDGLREEQHDATLHVATGCATLYENAGWDVWFPIIVEDGEEVDNNIASYVCDFTTKVSKHSAYNDAWTYDTEWTVYGGANNNAGWDYVKMGGKSGTLANANPVYVMNKNRMGRNITAIRVTYPSGSFPKNNQMDCSEWGVKVYSDLACTNLLYTVTSSVTITGAAQVVTLKPVPGQPWKAGYGIQVYWNLSNTGSTNGIIWVSKIEYLTDADDAATLWPMYNISFVNWDGFVLQSYPVRENTMPVFEGVTPVHAADAEYTYEFSGWSPEIVAATADAVYTAQYTATPKPVIPDDPDPGTGVDNVQSNEVKCTKILYNGQLYIIRGDMIFNASGMRIK